MSKNENKTVTISLEAAQLIRAVYLPANPNKLRTATPEVKAAVIEMLAAISKVESL
jgi:hypothetical protein